MKDTLQGGDSSARTMPETGENPAGDPWADQGRRRFVKLNLVALSLAPLAGLLVSESAGAARTRGQTTAMLNPDDPQAKSLDYTPRSPRDQQSCSNCQLYSGIDGAERGPCAIFSYHKEASSGGPLWVSATGWCRAWAPRQPRA